MADTEDPNANLEETPAQPEQYSRPGSEGNYSRKSSAADLGNESSVNANPLRQPPRPGSASQSGSRPGSAPFRSRQGSDAQDIQQEQSNSGMGYSQRGASHRGSMLERSGSMAGGLRRKSTAREMAQQLRRSHSMAEGMGGQSLRKRPTLASMMLSGTYAGEDDDAEGGHEQSKSGGGGFMSEEYGAFDDTGSEAQRDKLAAEQIFMPNMKREQFIPVRIARDKVKQVLAEMAQMKSMHYAAIDTMEKQYEFLKAQLEASVATYTKKLTTDYNDRVTALEAEYRRRLENMGETAMVDLQRTLDRSKEQAADNEKRLNARIEEKDKEIEAERKMVQAKIDMESAKSTELQAKLNQANHQIEELTIELRVAKGDGRDTMEESTSNRQMARVLELESKTTEMSAALKEKDSVIQSKDEEIAQLQKELAEAQEQLALGGGGAQYGDGQYGQEDYGGGYGGNGEDDEEGEGGPTIVNAEGDEL